MKRPNHLNAQQRTTLLQQAMARIHSKIKVLSPDEMRAARIRSSQETRLMTPRQFLRHWKRSGGNCIPNPWGQAKGL